MNKLKRIFAAFLCVTLIFSSAFSVQTFAAAGALEEVTAVPVPGVSDEAEPMASDLIVSAYTRVEKIALSSLRVYGTTECTSEVVKCGYKELVVERRKTSSDKWTEYVSYEELYSESNKHTLDKAMSVQEGYQYRVTAIHYAKKSWISTQKVTVVSNVVSF